MKCKKNWFSYFSISLAIVGFIYIFASSISALGSTQEYPYLRKGMVFTSLFLCWMAVLLVSKILVHFRAAEIFPRKSNRGRITELLCFLLILAGAFLVRVWVLQSFPVTPAVFGTGTQVELWVNLFFSIGSIGLIYYIGRKCGGRICAVAAMVLCAFWPSQVLYSSILSEEPAFTFLIFLCGALFLHVTMDYNKDKGKPVICCCGHLLLGILLALTAAVRPIAVLMIVAILLCLLPQKMELPAKPLNEIPLMLRLIRWGWNRCILILIPYLLVSNIIWTDIEREIDRDLASAHPSFAENSLTGLKLEEKDSIYILLDSLVQKYELLWGNDDYGTTENRSLLEEQGSLTQWHSDFLNSMQDYNNMVYCISVSFGIIGLLFLYKRKGNYLQVFVFLYLGTAAIYLLAESENRYHYFVLPVFMLLAGYGVQAIYQDARKETKKRKLQKERIVAENHFHEKQEREYKEMEEQVEKIREEALSNIFDMEKALKEGSIVMTVSEAYQEKEPPNGAADEK